MTLERGALLHNRYRILEILGQGGMGSIYRAVDDNLGVEVAVKENLFTTEEYARQFRREAIILASLKHPNLPRVSDHFVIEGQGQYLVMDYIEGEDLRERMDRAAIIPESEAIVVGVAICEAMAYMHGQRPPVLHRDIKPGNVRIAPNGHIFLVDFGLAKVVQGGEQTATGARAMTPGYSPPEQYGAARTDHRSDIFSLGATLYAAVTGTIPEDSLARTMEQMELTPVRKRNPRVTRRLSSAIEKALAVHPDDRFQSAEELKNALLSARGITLRRFAEQGTLPPAASINGEDPVFSDTSPRPDSLDHEDGSEDAPSLPLPASAQLSPDFASGDLDLPPSKRRRRRRGCLLTVLLLIAFALVSGVFLVWQGPTLPIRYSDMIPDRILSMLPPEAEAVSIFTPEASPTEKVRASETAAVSTQTPTQTTIPDTVTVTPTSLPTATSTSTPLPSPTSSPEPTVTPSPTPMGGGFGQVAFASDRTGLPQIWIVDSNGTNLTQITNTQQGACQPNWAPDGTQLVFISPCNEHQETYAGASMFIINEDGTGLTPLPTIGGGDYDPKWSPDGTQIIFTSLRDGRPRIYLMDLADKSVELLSISDKFDMQPAWSTDGSQVVYISTHNGPYQVWVMNADGSDPVRFSASGNLRNLYPVWSVDGRVLVYTQKDSEAGVPRLMAARYPDDAVSEFKVYPYTGSIPMRKAVYSPDGYWLALESWPDGTNHDIYIMTPNGAERTQLTTDPAFDFDPAWRPTTP